MSRIAAWWIVVLGLVGPSLAFAGEGHGGGEPGGPTYVRLPPISFSVIGPANKIDKQMNLMLDLELADGKTEQMLEPYRRPLQDSFLTALAGLYEDESVDEQVPPELLKQRLLEAATEVAGPGLIRSVLLISIGERRHF